MVSMVDFGYRIVTARMTTRVGEDVCVYVSMWDCPRRVYAPEMASFPIENSHYRMLSKYHGHTHVRLERKVAVFIPLDSLFNSAYNQCLGPHCGTCYG